MMLRAGRKRARDVSLYDTIGTDKDGETVSLMDVLEADEIQALDTIIMEQDVKELYQAYETYLKDTEKQVIRMRYGLFGSREHTQREVAAVLGISRSYVSRIEKRAVEKLREAF